jgi:hypothetical protein
VVVGLLWLRKAATEAGYAPFSRSADTHAVTPVRREVLAGEQVVLLGNHLVPRPLLGPDLGHREPPEGRILGHREDVLHLAQPRVDALEDRDPMPPGLRLPQGREDVI